MAWGHRPQLEEFLLSLEKEGVNELAGRAVGFTGRPHVDD
jgi:hypothetical protein